jgi:thymidylate synthase ThyX
VHKQIVNRILEPYAHIRVVFTATEWDNFFNLRRHDDAQPEIKCLADNIWDAMQESVPVRTTGWHLPYVLPDELNNWPEDACIMYSVARCARVSYMNHGMTRIDHIQDAKLHDILLRDGHMSPFEHQARPLMIGDPINASNFRGWMQYRKMLPNEAVFRPKG